MLLTQGKCLCGVVVLETFGQVRLLKIAVSVSHPALVLFLHHLHALAVLQAQLLTKRLVLLSNSPFSLGDHFLHIELLLGLLGVVALLRRNPIVRLNTLFP